MVKKELLLRNTLWMQKLVSKKLLSTQDQLIKKMAMEQKMRRESAAREQRRIRAGQNPHAYNAQLL